MNKQQVFNGPGGKIKIVRCLKDEDCEFQIPHYYFVDLDKNKILELLSVVHNRTKAVEIALKLTQLSDKVRTF